jgi:protoporphyrinogen oxidase
MAKASSAAIIGGGIGGVTLAYELAKAGVEVTIYERGAQVGGLATFLNYNGVRIDRFYHTILSSDLSMQKLIEETGVKDVLHFTETKQGFYDNGHVYPFNTPVDFLKFPPLNIFQRFRLGLQIIAAQFEKDATKMDAMPVEKWLLRVSGRGVVEKVWKPLLRAKFDSETQDIPATYIWSRLRRMMSTRQGVTSKEMMCYLEGGYFTLIAALVEKCKEIGVKIEVQSEVKQVLVENGRVVGLEISNSHGTQECRFDAIIGTLSSPIFSRMLPEVQSVEEYRETLSKQEYLGVLCPLLLLRKRLTPYYVLNITDASIPFTAVVETTNLIDPQYVGDYHLVYLPKYLTPDSELMKWSDEQVKTEWMRHFQRMFPDYDVADIEAFLVQKTGFVEPLIPIGKTDQIPEIQTPLPGLYLSNSVMVYPALNNGESITQLARRTAQTVLANLPTA